MTIKIKTSKKYKRLRILIAFGVAFRSNVCPNRGRLRYYTSHIEGVKSFRTHLKNVFCPNIFVGASLQILNIQQYASGMRPTKIIESDGKSSNAGKLGSAAILNQNPIFEMGSR